MDSSTKILIGSVVTVLMALCAHHLFNTGYNFVDGLEEEANAQIAASGVNDVDVIFERDPAVTRTAILTGDVSENERDELIKLVQDIDGVGEVRWAENHEDIKPTEIAAEATSETAPQNGAVISKCQSDINAVMADKKINFNSGSAYVGPSNFKLIDEIVATLEPCNELRIEIQGHTDLIGSDSINQAMSEARAQSVKTILVERGLNAANITIRGYGATQPIENARTSAANEKNRRTIFVIESIDK